METREGYNYASIWAYHFRSKQAAAFFIALHLAAIVAYWQNIAAWADTAGDMAFAMVIAASVVGYWIGSIIHRRKLEGIYASNRYWDIDYSTYPDIRWKRARGKILDVMDWGSAVSGMGREALERAWLDPQTGTASRERYTKAHREYLHNDPYLGEGRHPGTVNDGALSLQR